MTISTNPRVQNIHNVKSKSTNDKSGNDFIPGLGNAIVKQVPLVKSTSFKKST